MEGKSGFSFQTGQKNTFSILDYVIFSATLVISTCIGFFFAIKDRNKGSTKLFLLAGGNMNFIPVAMSLLASFMSAITLLGTPAEMYNFSTIYWWIGLSYAGAVGMAAHIYIPIFYNLGLTSCYEYLELRFSRGVRLMGTCIFSTQMMIYMSIVLYGPSLALNAVTGISLWGAVVSVGTLCTIYTAVGGMKAVLWTDTFQSVMMIVGLMATLIQGCIEIGGFSKAWDIAYKNERVRFDDFSPDPSVRHSVWSCVIGGAFLWVSVYGTNQAQVQRSLSCGSLKQAKLALWLNFPGLCTILMLACLVGIVMYAFYSTCDPIKFGLIMASDQLYPLFVMDLLSHVPGVPGLFVACIFSGTLSTISSGLNSLAAVALTDFIRPFIAPNMSERKATNVSKLLALTFGVICLGLTYVASLLGNILQAALSLFGMLGAPMLGLFTLGMVFPWANYIGAYVGTIVSLLMMLWIGIGAYITKPIFWRAPISVEGCNWNLTLESDTSSAINSSTIASSLTSAVSSVVNVTTSTVAQHESNPIDKLYTLSYLWYSATALLIVVVVGMTASLISGRQDPKKIDARLICPLFDVLFPYLPDKWRKPLRFGVVHKGKYDLPPSANGEAGERITTRTDLLRKSVQLELEVDARRLEKLRTPEFGQDIEDKD